MFWRRNKVSAISEKQLADLKHRISDLECMLKSKDTALNYTFSKNEKLSKENESLKLIIGEACSILMPKQKDINAEK